MMDSKTLARYRGRQTISVARTSTDQQDVSITDQLTANRRILDELETHLVEELRLPDLSASHPGNREDLQGLIERRQRRGDFDMLIFYDHSRLTRFGPKHGMALLWRFEELGVKVLFAADGIPSGPYGDMASLMHFMAAQEFARKLARDSARGQMSALLDGRRKHANVPAYGVDRMILAADRRPKFLLRNRSDGSQEQIDIETGRILQTFPKGQRYRKQRAELVDLVPGDPAQLAVIARIYQLRFRQGWGSARIPQLLNDEGIPGPRGGRWSSWTVRALLRNPIYTGFGWANRINRAIYFNRGDGGPQEVDYEISDRTKRKHPEAKLRPREQWHKVDVPAFRDFLPDDLRAAAMAYQDQYWDWELEGKTERQMLNRDRHQNSPYLLKGLLVEASSGLKMTGRRTGQGKYARRYYQVTRSYSHPCKADGALRKGVPAEPLERIVLNALVVTINRFPLLQQGIRHRLTRHQAVDTCEQERRRLEGQLEDVLERQRRILRYGNLAPDVAEQEMEAAAQERKRLESRLSQLSDTPGLPLDDLDQQLAAVMQALTDLRSDLFAHPPAGVRELIRLLVPRVEVDAATRQASFEVRLPSWALVEPTALSLDVGSEPRTYIEAPTLELPLYRCLAFWSEGRYWGYGKAA